MTSFDDLDWLEQAVAKGQKPISALWVRLRELETALERIAVSPIATDEANKLARAALGARMVTPDDQTSNASNEAETDRK